MKNLFIIIAVLAMALFVGCDNTEEYQNEEKKAIKQEEIPNIQSIEFSDVNIAAEKIDKILKSKVKNYMRSDVSFYKDGKYIVDVYLKLESTNGSDGAEVLS